MLGQPTFHRYLLGASLEKRAPQAIRGLIVIVANGRISLAFLGTAPMMLRKRCAIIVLPALKLGRCLPSANQVARR